MTSPYRDVVDRTPDPAWLPRPWWRRIPCLIGRHEWTGVAGLGEVGVRRPIHRGVQHVALEDKFSPYFDQGAAWCLCRACGRIGRGTVIRTIDAGSIRSLPKYRVHPARYGGPPVVCTTCRARHPAPILHGCPPGYEVAPPKDVLTMDEAPGKAEVQNARLLADYLVHPTRDAVRSLVYALRRTQGGKKGDDEEW